MERIVEEIGVNYFEGIIQSSGLDDPRKYREKDQYINVLKSKYIDAVFSFAWQNISEEDLQKICYGVMVMLLADYVGVENQYSRWLNDTLGSFKNFLTSKGFVFNDNNNNRGGGSNPFQQQSGGNPYNRSSVASVASVFGSRPQIDAGNPMSQRPSSSGLSGLIPERNNNMNLSDHLPNTSNPFGSPQSQQQQPKPQEPIAPSRPIVLPPLIDARNEWDEAFKFLLSGSENTIVSVDSDTKAETEPNTSVTAASMQLSEIGRLMVDAKQAFQIETYLSKFLVEEHAPYGEDCLDPIDNAKVIEIINSLSKIQDFSNLLQAVKALIKYGKTDLVSLLSNRVSELILKFMYKNYGIEEINHFPILLSYEGPLKDFLVSKGIESIVQQKTLWIINKLFTQCTILDLSSDTDVKISILILQRVEFMLVVPTNTIYSYINRTFKVTTKDMDSDIANYLIQRIFSGLDELEDTLLIIDRGFNVYRAYRGYMESPELDLIYDLEKITL